MNSVQGGSNSPLPSPIAQTNEEKRARAKDLRKHGAADYAEASRLEAEVAKDTAKSWVSNGASFITSLLPTRALEPTTTPTTSGNTSVWGVQMGTAVTLGSLAIGAALFFSGLYLEVAAGIMLHQMLFTAAALAALATGVTCFNQMRANRSEQADASAPVTNSSPLTTRIAVKADNAMNLSQVPDIDEEVIIAEEDVRAAFHDMSDASKRGLASFDKFADQEKKRAAASVEEKHQAELEKLKQDQVSTQGELTNSQDSLRKANDQLQSHQAELEDHRKQIGDLNESLDKEKKKNTDVEAKAQADIQAAEAKHKNELSQLEASKKGETDAAKKEIDELKTKWEVADKSRADAEAALKPSQDEAKALKAENTQLKVALKAAEDNVSAFNKIKQKEEALHDEIEKLDLKTIPDQTASVTVTTSATTAPVTEAKNKSEEHASVTQLYAQKTPPATPAITEAVDNDKLAAQAS